MVRSLEAALWAFHRGESFRDGALLAVNLGDDADTTGAIYGQLAGTFHGEQGIPAAWRGRLAQRELIESFADRLLELRSTLAGRAGGGIAPPPRQERFLYDPATGFEGLMDFFRAVSGREPTAEDVAESRRVWDEGRLEELSRRRREGS